MNNISAWAIRHPIPIFLLFTLLTVLGFGSFKGLGINQWPDVDFPMMVVTITRPGSSPSELETDITRKVEDALVGIKDLDHIRSTIVEGTSTTVVEFKVGANSETALNDVRDSVSRIRQQLPQDINEPIINHPNGSGDPFITYALTSESRPQGELSKLIDEDITRSLLTVPGVASVRREGGLTREIRVKLSPARLQAMGTSVDFVNGQLRSLNLNLPGGKSELAGGDVGIRTMGSVRTIEQLRALAIPLGNGHSARLDELGTVEDAFADVSQIARFDGQPVVGFSVIRSQGAPLVQTEEGTRAQIALLEKAMPADLHFKLVRTQATFTRASYHASIDALVIGALLAVVVIYAFLRNWQSTFISGLAIPLSVIPTFWIMSMAGYSLNGMTTLALTLVVGILVDDAIVDLENIHRHIDMGKTPWKAAFEATAEIGLAVVATTMTIVVVFLPVSFMGGIPGMFFRSFGISVAVSVLFSLLVARTLTPLLAAYLLPPAKAHHVEKEPFYRAVYMRILRWSLAHRWRVLAGATAVFFASLMLIPFIPKGFINNGDTGEAIVSVALPSGVGIADTDRVAQEVIHKLQAHPAVASVFSTVGGSADASASFNGSGGGGLASGTLYVGLKPRHERTVTLDQFMEQIGPELRAIPGARVAVNKAGAGGGGASKGVNMILRGTDPEALDRAAAAVLKEMRGMADLRDVTSSAAEMRPEIQIRPDSDRAAEQGVLVATVGRAARVATQGDTPVNMPKFNAGDEQIDIRVQLADQVKQDLSAIGSLMLPGKNGMVPLRAVADVSMGEGPVQVNRYDRARQVTLSANIAKGNLGTAMDKIKALPSMRNLPPGVEQGSLGEAKIMADIFAGFGRAFGLGILLIYTVLVLSFGGFLQPLTIMGALPLAIGGAFLSLLIGGKELGMMGLIGIVMLMGLVTKNSILLVEYALQGRAKGLGREEALLQAGHDRLRPIIMTTIAMIAGMLPIAMSFGEGTERLSPLATAVIGGLITSTLLTLVVIPVAYTFVDDIGAFLARRLNFFGDRGREEGDEDEAPTDNRDERILEHGGTARVVRHPEP